jgi:hypothetical protein
MADALRIQDALLHHWIPCNCSKMLHQYDTEACPHTIEIIDPTRHYPKWIPDVTMETEGDMTTAARRDTEAEEDL